MRRVLSVVVLLGWASFLGCRPSSGGRALPSGGGGGGGSPTSDPAPAEPPFLVIPYTPQAPADPALPQAAPAVLAHFLVDVDPVAGTAAVTPTDLADPSLDLEAVGTASGPGGGVGGYLLLTRSGGAANHRNVDLRMGGLSDATVTLDGDATADGEPAIVLGDLSTDAAAAGAWEATAPAGLPFRFTVAVCTCPDAPQPRIDPQATGTDDVEAILGATESTRGQGNRLAYRWSVAGRPVGSAAEVDEEGSPSPRILFDRPGTYRVDLLVSDGVHSSAVAHREIEVDPSNPAPHAEAGPHRRALVGETVTLDGSGSFDRRGDPITVAWDFVHRPNGSAAALSGAATVAPSFVPDVPGTYVVRIRVSDGTKETVDVTIVRVRAANSPPVAAIDGPDFVLAGEWAQLSGTASRDPDGDPLTFAWALTRVPDGSQVALADAAAAEVSFRPDAEGYFVVELVVSDGFATSEPAFHEVNVRANLGAPVFAGGGRQQVPHAAYSPLHDHYLVVYSDDAPGSFAVMGQLVAGGTGDLIGAPQLIDGGADGIQPWACYNPDTDRFLVAWTDFENGRADHSRPDETVYAWGQNGDIMVREVDGATGLPLGARVNLTASSTLTDQGAVATYDLRTRRYVLAYYSYGSWGNVYAMSLDSTLTPTTPRFIFGSGCVWSMAGAYDPTRGQTCFMFAGYHDAPGGFEFYADVYAAVVDGWGNVVVPATLIAGADEDQGDGAIAYDRARDRYILAWERHAYHIYDLSYVDRTSRIEAVEVSPRLQIARNYGTLADLPGDDLWAVPVVEEGSNRVLVTWANLNGEAGVHGVALNATTGGVDGVPFRISDPRPGTWGHYPVPSTRRHEILQVWEEKIQPGDFDIVHRLLRLD